MFTINKIQSAFDESINLKEKLKRDYSQSILDTGATIAETFKNSHKAFFCGNGGSAADSQHIVAELVVRFRSNINRKALPALALTVDPSISSAGGNDLGFENVFARQLEAFGSKGDVLIGISTSGNSENVYRAVLKAKELGVVTIGLLGGDGGKIAGVCDQSIIAPSKITARIQEAHITIGHIWCEIIEEYLFPELF